MVQAREALAGIESARGVRTRTLTLRSVSLVVHRYVGLVMTVFLVVAGLTGSLLAFYRELDGALSPSLLRVSPPALGARPLDPIELRERLEAALPVGSFVGNIPLLSKPGEAVELEVEYVPADATKDNAFFVDPYTGRVLGSRRYADLSQGIRNLMPFVYRLHYSLALGTVGTYLFGVVALLWTVDCFVGAYLTFPLHSAARSPGTAPRGGARRWLNRWKPSWLLRASKLFSLVFTWHRASGLWVWAALLVFAWSAVGLNLHEVYEPVMQLAFGMEEPASQRLPKLEQPRPEPVLSWYEARSTGQRLMAERAKSSGFEVIEAYRLGYEPELGAFRYRVRSSLDVSDRYPSTAVWLDGDSGNLIAFDAPTGESTGRTLTTWLYQLHFGAVAIGGMPYRIFVCLMGVAVTLLSVTGLWIWLRKRNKRAAHA
jgi:uncharacterized iron-regulated membrane protein